MKTSRNLLVRGSKIGESSPKTYSTRTSSYKSIPIIPQDECVAIPANLLGQAEHGKEKAASCLGGSPKEFMIWIKSQMLIVNPCQVSAAKLYVPFLTSFLLEATCLLMVL